MSPEAAKSTRFGKLKLLIIIAALVLIGALIYGIHSVLRAPDPNRAVLWGTTFSARYAENLGLDSKETLAAILEDLGVKHLRLIAYWDLVEPERGEFQWDEVDYEMNLAASHGADVILAYGVREPRWPECYYPKWTGGLSDKERRDEIKNFLVAVTERYKNNPAIKYLQIENESYLPWGSCAHKDIPEFLAEEIKIVKNIDDVHPILLTGSPVIDPWYPEARQADVFGTSLYRSLYNESYGNVKYPFGPLFYRLKEKISRFIIRDFQKKFIVSELQAEPWIKGGINAENTEEQLQNFNVQTLEYNTKFALSVGFNEYYFWGSEWWYFLKTKESHPELWDFAKGVFESSR
jgi:hypothetical protein